MVIDVCTCISAQVLVLPPGQALEKVPKQGPASVGEAEKSCHEEYLPM